MVNVSIHTLLHIWEKAISVPGYDPNIWRKDFAGAWIRKDSYQFRIQSDIDKIVEKRYGERYNLRIEIRPDIF